MQVIDQVLPLGSAIDSIFNNKVRRTGLLNCTNNTLYGDTNEWNGLDQQTRGSASVPVPGALLTL